MRLPVTLPGLTALVLSIFVLFGNVCAENVDLIETVKNGDKVAVQSLLDAGADVNLKGKEGKTPLFWAVGQGHADMVRLLIDSGAVVKERIEGGSIHRVDGSRVEIVDLEGWTALMQAADQGHVDIVRLLIDSGADVNARIEGGSIHRVDGSQVEIVDLEGWTALMQAADQGHVDIVRLLIDSGADKYAKSQDGNTAIRRAERKGHPEIAEMLKGFDHSRTQKYIGDLEADYSIDRISAADALGEMGPEARTAVEALGVALRDGNWRVRKAAATALGKIGTTSIPVLVVALNDSDENVRALAAEALGEIGPPARLAVPTLVLKLDDKFYVRKTVIIALGKIRDTSAVAPLSQASLHDDYVRQDAQRAIAEIRASGKPKVKKILSDLEMGEPGAVPKYDT